mgnify:CR=1 FL=1
MEREVKKREGNKNRLTSEDIVRSRERKKRKNQRKGVLSLLLLVDGRVVLAVGGMGRSRDLLGNFLTIEQGGSLLERAVLGLDDDCMYMSEWSCTGY